MGIITDYVIADVNEAQAVLDSMDPTSQWPCVDLKWINTVKLAQLGLILDHKPTTLELFEEYHPSIKHLVSGGEEGPWVLLVPQQLTNQLAGLAKTDFSRVGTQWHAIEEFQLDQWQQADVLAVLEDLHELAKKALGLQKPLLLFISL